MSDDGTATRAERESSSGPDGLLARLSESDDGPVFEAPWQARAFGLVAALHDEDDDFDWAAFQRRLIEEVEATEREAYDTIASEADGPEAHLEGVYYEQWLAVCERLLVEEGYLDAAEIEDRAAEFADGTRSAEEFVDGERGH